MFRRVLISGILILIVLLITTCITIVGYSLFTTSKRIRLYELSYKDFEKKKNQLGGVIEKHLIEKNSTESFDSKANYNVDYIWYYFPDMEWSFENPVFFTYVRNMEEDYVVPKSNHIIYISGKCTHSLTGYEGFEYYKGTVYK